MALGPRVGYDCRVNNSPPQWVGALLDVVERIRFMVTARRDRRRGRADLWDDGLAGRLLTADWFWQPETAHSLLTADPVFA